MPREKRVNLGAGTYTYHAADVHFTAHSELDSPIIFITIHYIYSVHVPTCMYRSEKLP